MARPVLEKALGGGTGTIFMFGQTGSGKTHTMSAIQQQVAEDVFSGGAGEEVHLMYFELKGAKACVDLMSDDKAELKLLAAEDGSTQVLGAKKAKVTSASELNDYVTAALSRRETGATAANANSSRSHAVCRLFFGSAGVLTLVDLAGSERKEDSVNHDAKRRKESAEINASLHALKECIRMRALQSEAVAAGKPAVHIPYRGHNLTKVLKSSLDDDEALTIVIATTSPGSSDQEHSMSTLDTVCMISGLEGAAARDADVREVEDWKPAVAAVPVAKWTAAVVEEFVQTTQGGKFQGAKLQSGLDGKLLLRMNAKRFSGCFASEELGTALYTAVREEVKRVETIEKERRAAVIEVKKGKNNIASAYSKALAPRDPTAAE